jgi:hypothetical protein
MRKIFAILLALVLIGIGVSAWRFWGQRYELVLTEEQLRHTLNEKFPFDKTYFSFIHLRFSNPHIQLENGSNRIRFGCEVESKIKLDTNFEKIPGVLRGNATVSGKLRYEATQGTFFLDEPKVEDLGVAGLPIIMRSKVREAASKAAVEFLGRAPLYRFKRTDIKQAAARLVLREVEIVDEKLIITMGIG